MATIEQVSRIGRSSLLGDLTKGIGQAWKWGVRQKVTIGAVFRMILRLALMLGALTLFSVAAFYVAFVAGLITVGASLLVLEWAVKKE